MKQNRGIFDWEHDTITACPCPTSGSHTPYPFTCDTRVEGWLHPCTAVVSGIRKPANTGRVLTQIRKWPMPVMGLHVSCQPGHEYRYQPQTVTINYYAFHMAQCSFHTFLQMGTRSKCTDTTLSSVTLVKSRIQIFISTIFILFFILYMSFHTAFLSGTATDHRL